MRRLILFLLFSPLACLPVFGMAGDHPTLTVSLTPEETLELHEASMHGFWYRGTVEKAIITIHFPKGQAKMQCEEKGYQEGKTGYYGHVNWPEGIAYTWPHFIIYEWGGGFSCSDEG